MGSTFFPYQTCQELCIADKIIKGNLLNKERKNSFMLNGIYLNLPGCPMYSPSFGKYKSNKEMKV